MRWGLDSRLSSARYRDAGRTPDLPACDSGTRRPVRFRIPKRDVRRTVVRTRRWRRRVVGDRGDGAGSVVARRGSPGVVRGDDSHGEGIAAIGLNLAQVVPARVRDWLTRIPDNAVLSLISHPTQKFSRGNEPKSNTSPSVSGSLWSGGRDVLDARGRPLAEAFTCARRGGPQRQEPTGDPFAGRPRGSATSRQRSAPFEASVRLPGQHEASYARGTHELRTGGTMPRTSPVTRGSTPANPLSPFTTGRCAHLSSYRPSTKIHPRW